MGKKIKIYLGILFCLFAVYDIAYSLQFDFSLIFNIHLEGGFWFKDINNSWGQRGFFQLGIFLLLSAIANFLIVRSKNFKIELFIYRLQRFLCYYLCFIFFSYGFSKVFGNQFSMDIFFADKPLSQLSGFEWTWLFFGYSYVYGLFIAFSQFIGATLLVFNRTKYIGTLLLIPVIFNIIFIDYCYSIGNDVKVISVFYLLVLLYIIQPVIKPIFSLLLSESASAYKSLIHGNLKYNVLKALLFFAIVFECFYFNYVQKMKYHFSQLVTGVWKTETVSINNQEYNASDTNGSVPKKIYFEKGGHCYLKYNTTDDMENCKIVSDSIYLTDRQHTLDFAGKFQLGDSLLFLTGTIHKTIPAAYRLHLIRHIN